MNIEVENECLAYVGTGINEIVHECTNDTLPEYTNDRRAGTNGFLYEYLVYVEARFGYSMLS